MNAYNALRKAIIPFLASPSNCATVTQSPTLTWNALIGVTSYRLQLASDFNFTNILRDTSGISGTSCSLSGLSATTKYFWRISALTVDGVRYWSDAFWFKTTPPVPVILKKGSYTQWVGGVKKTYPRLSWVVPDWCNLSHVLYRYACSQVHNDCIPEDCNLTGSVVYSGSDTVYIDMQSETGNDSCITIHYYVKTTATVNGTTALSNKVVYGTTGDIWKEEVSEQEVSLPQRTTLFDNFPDPFNPQTIIRYTLAEPGEVKLTVMNTLGQIVQTLVDAYEEAGAKSITFDASSLPSGVYYYRLQSRKFSDLQKMVLLK